MAQDIHSQIKAWLAAHPPTALAEDPREGAHCMKAGVLPYLPETQEFYVMKPVARHAELAPPPFQIAKGTRMAWSGGKWQDGEGEVREALAVTALREGVEELGLQLDCIHALYDLGLFSFTSASTGKPKPLWLFLARMRARESFLPSDAVAATTAERAWMDREAFARLGRPDHAAMLAQAQAMLGDNQ